MSDKPVDASDVQYIADLARIQLAATEVDQFLADFNELLEYFDRLDEVPAVTPEEQPTQTLRSDDVCPSLSAEEVFRNVSEEQTEDDYFKGPKVG